VPQREGEDEADDSAVEQVRREGGIANLLPRPTEKLPFLSYAVSVLASAFCFFVYTWGTPAPLALLSFAPTPFGFWLGVKRRGNPYGIYVVTSVSVGLLNVAFVVGEELVAGRISKLWRTLPEVWLPNLLWWGLTPTLLFLAGALLGDVVKRRAWPESLAEPTNDAGQLVVDRRLTDRQTIIAAIISSVAAVVAALIGEWGGG
jgi:hypothetical protein